MASLPSFSSIQKHEIEERGGHENATLTTAPIGLPAPRVYPRLHLLGLPQELRDEIYVKTFGGIGSRSLRPLLACRQIYHEANNLAWSKAWFDLSGLSDIQLITLSTRLPARVTSRQVHTLSIPGWRVPLLTEHRDLLPRTENFWVIDVATLLRGRGETAYHGWYYLMHRTALFRFRTESIWAPPIAFTEAARTQIRHDEMHAQWRVLYTRHMGMPCSPATRVIYGKQLEPERRKCYLALVQLPASQESPEGELVRSVVYCMDTSYLIAKIREHIVARKQLRWGRNRVRWDFVGIDRGYYSRMRIEA